MLKRHWRQVYAHSRIQRRIHVPHWDAFPSFVCPAACKKEPAEVGNIFGLIFLWVIHTSKGHEPESTILQDKSQGCQVRVVVKTLRVAVFIGNHCLLLSFLTLRNRTYVGTSRGRSSARNGTDQGGLSIQQEVTNQMDLYSPASPSTGSKKNISQFFNLTVKACTLCMLWLIISLQSRDMQNEPKQRPRKLGHSGQFARAP